MRKETSKIQITAKLLVAAAAIVHLIFTYVHTNALLLLEDQICRVHHVPVCIAGSCNSV